MTAEERHWYISRYNDEQEKRQKEEQKQYNKAKSSHHVPSVRRR